VANAARPNIVVILTDDLSETKNLAGSNPEKVRELSEAYDEWIATMADPITGGDTRMEDAGNKTGKSDQASQPATIMSPIVEAPTAPVTGPHPGSRFDLSHWKLTLPINVAKTYSGHASEIGAGQLASGFKDSHFQTDTEGAMVFWCPVIGSTTEGTEFPRCELPEMLEPGNPGHNWKIKLEDGVLSVDVNGVTQTENMIQHDDSWARQTFYFKAGAYPQDDEGDGSEGARVSFSNLRVSHCTLEDHAARASRSWQSVHNLGWSGP
jgi:hypothetical protein